MGIFVGKYDHINTEKSVRIAVSHGLVGSTLVTQMICKNMKW